MDERLTQMNPAIWHAVCTTEDPYMPPGGRRPNTSTKDHPMQAISQVPVLVAAVQYSIIYMLLGGGVFGAIVVYFVAKVLGK
jgi:hypothetical protein